MAQVEKKNAKVYIVYSLPNEFENTITVAVTDGNQTGFKTGATVFLVRILY